MKKCLLTLSLITALSVVANAQNSISAAISSSVNSTVDGIPTLAAFALDTEIQNGLITAPVTYTIKSNRTWKLMTSITAITSAVIGGGPATILAPLQPLNISWGVINGTAGTVTSFTAFANTTTTTAAAVETKIGGRGAGTVTGNTFTLRYKVIPSFDVDPGTYTVTMTNTVSAQ